MPSSATGSATFTRFTIEDARRYDAWYATAGRWMAQAEARLLLALLAALPSTRSILEVGCGTGHFARVFARRGLAVAGLDPSATMLTVARERGGATYVRGVAEALPFAATSFDTVAFVTSLEFVADPPAALREAARVARSGLLLGVLNQASLLGLRRMLTARIRPSLYREARFYTPASLARLVRDSLDERAVTIRWRTTLWPFGLGGPVERLPCGGFIGLAVTLTREGRSGTP